MKLLDTDICIGIMKAVPAVVAAWRDCQELCAIPAMAIGELCYGAAKSSNPPKELEKVGRLAGVLSVVDITRAVMMRFGMVKADLERNGIRLADADVIIAATALESGMTLVTGNTRHFSRIDGLKMENWFVRP